MSFCVFISNGKYIGINVNGNVYRGFGDIMRSPRQSKMIKYHDIYGSNDYVYNVITDCNASNDGITDNVGAFQMCFDKLSNNGGKVYIPAGKYYLSKGITINPIHNGNSRSNITMTINGDGWSSVIYHGFDDHLFTFQTYIEQLQIQNIKIESISVNKSVKTSALYFPEGILQSYFINVLITNNIYAPYAPGNKYEHPMNRHDIYYDGKERYSDINGGYFDNWVNVGSGIIILKETSSVLFDNVIIWELTGIGIQISTGAEVRITNGQIYGIGGVSGRQSNPASIGVKSTGNNGGIHLESNDINGLGIGLLLTNDTGYASNREVFITQSTFDSSGYGIYVNDSSYINFIGCWTASNDFANIFVVPNVNPSLNIVGGTIFNAGVYGQNVNCDTDCNGLEMSSGNVMLNGVFIRQNKGKGIWMKGDTNYNVINGCYIYNNHIQYAFDNNETIAFYGNLCYEPQYNHRMYPSNTNDNLNCPGF